MLEICCYGLNLALATNMIEVLENIQSNDALILTAPPGWGKTYRLLAAIRSLERQVVFIFPLRALCDEVYLSALQKKIRVYNIRNLSDYKDLHKAHFDLLLCTPELYRPMVDENIIHILDEFHLFYYWGDSFREKMNEIYQEIVCASYPLILLTATLSDTLKKRVESELKLNYQNIYHLNFGNQKLKNLPNRLFYYPPKLSSYLRDDFMYSSHKGASLVFCQYRQQVYSLKKDLERIGYKVLSCVGGEASDFIKELNQTVHFDFIVATSVVSHGVNLPKISKLYFLYNVSNLDFYLQMIGRGGRDGGFFEVHIQNNNYFSKKELLIGFFNVLIKRLSNRMNCLLYSLYES